jgi:osmotically-inducible protein OsmY
MFTMESPALQPQPPTVLPASVSELAESELRRNAYVALKNIGCDYRDGVLVLSGCLPTYYLKQLAQEAVARIDGIERVDNRIEVISPSRRIGNPC